MNNVSICIYEKIYAIVISMFFVAQILSPYVNDRTIYLELIISLFNLYMWKWLLPIRLKLRHCCILICLCVIGGLGHPITSIKLFLNLYYVIILSYLWERKLWYIDVMIVISVFVSILQLILLSADLELARMIGPENISKMIWGGYSTPALTNLYDAFGFGFVRASGLSREAGFLASLIVVALIHTVVCKSDKFRNEVCFYIIGYFTSFSKMSFSLFPAYVIVKFRKYIDRIPLIIMLGLFAFFMCSYWSTQTHMLNQPENITFLSRFGGYDAIRYLDIEQLLLGENDLSKIGGLSAINEFYGENAFGGLAGWTISNGVVSLILFISILYLLKMSTTGGALLLLLTINVQPDTNQNFVGYAWFLSIYYFSSR